MKNRIPLIVLVGLLMTSMACSLFTFGGEQAPAPTEAPATTEPIALPTEAPTDTPEKDQSRANYEVAPLSKEQLWDTQELEDMKAEFIIDYSVVIEGEPMDISMIMRVETTTDPVASHVIMTMEGMDLEGMQDLGMTDGFNLEMYMIEDQIYMTGFFGDEWMVLSSEEDDFTEGLVIDPEEFVEVPPQAWRAPDPETVNGVSCWHYTFNDEDFEQFAPEEFEEIEYDQMTVDMWIAVDGGYMVRMEADMRGIASAEDAEMGIPEGEVMDINMVYNTLEINTGFSIELPPEAANAEPFDPFGMLGDLDEGGEDMQEVVPLPDDAQVTFSFTGFLEAETSWDFDQTKDWMIAELEAQGWVISDEFGDPSDGYILFLDLGEQSLMLILTESESGTTIAATLG